MSSRPGSSRVIQSAGQHGPVAHYPSIKPELVELTSALHALAHEARQSHGLHQRCWCLCVDRLEAGRASAGGALIAMDLPAIVKMGAHPLVPFLAADARSSGCDGKGIDARALYHHNISVCAQKVRGRARGSSISRGPTIT